MIVNRKIIVAGLILTAAIVTGVIIYAKEIARFVLCQGIEECITMIPPPISSPPMLAPPPVLIPSNLRGQYGDNNLLAIGIEPFVVKRLSDGILVRKYLSTDAEGKYTQIPDANDFHRIVDSSGELTPYFQAGTNIHLFRQSYLDSAPELVRIPADAATFVPGISTYIPLIAKDATRVYINGMVDSKIDAATLTAIPGHPAIFQDVSHVYQMTALTWWTEMRNAIEYEITPYEPPVIFFFRVTADDAEFGGYFKDKKNVFFQKEKILDADYDTFTVYTNPPLSGLKSEQIVYTYARDKQHVYYRGIIVPDADPSTFTPISKGGRYTYYYGKDATTVYEGATPIPKLDPRTTEILWEPQYEGCGDSHYIKDTARVFSEQAELEGVDAATFEPLHMNFGRDKNGIWEGATFRPDLPKDFVPACNYG